MLRKWIKKVVLKIKPLRTIYHWFDRKLSQSFRLLTRWEVKIEPKFRLKPVSRSFGLNRGLPIDRYYIENFLARHALDIKGRVLEIGENTYTRRFGKNRVKISDVLNLAKESPETTIVTDLTSAKNIPSGSFDCIILTQTLQMIYDLRSAMRTLYRILKPGGVLLVTIPGISQISRYDMVRWGDYWRFTTKSAFYLFKEQFPERNIKIESYGNVAVAVSYLHGLATEELTKKVLNYRDRDYQVLITVRAIKSA